jgi:beta-mannosidase
LVNDRADDLVGQLEVALIADGEIRVDEGTRAVRVAARGHETIDAGSLFDGFRDLTFAYRFGPPTHDVVAITLRGIDGREIAQTSFLPLGQARPVEAELGLRAVATCSDGDHWTLECSSRRFAQRVSMELAGFAPEDSWFDLPPGAPRTIRLRRIGDRDRPGGRLRALNARATTPVEVLDRP